PILSMKEIIEDQSLRATGTVVEVDHPTRGKYVSVGNPIKLSDSPSEVTRSPLLGEHTDDFKMRGRGMIAATHFFRRQAPLDRRSMRARVTPIRLAQNPRTSRLQAQ